MKMINPYSFADRLCDINLALKENSKDESNDLLSFVWNYFYKTQFNVLKAYLNKNKIFLDSKEYLNSVKRDYIPRIPMCIARPPNAEKRRLAFPAEESTNHWFTWLIFTQVFLNMLGNKLTCPIAAYNLDMRCKIEPSCFSMGDLLIKKDNCHIYTFFNTLNLKNYDK